MFPIIYTPTEGEAIANFSKLFRRPEGLFLNIQDQERIDEDIAQFGAPDDVDIIVVSDGEQVQPILPKIWSKLMLRQILGIGDQGVGAILISIAKLVIYTLCAGINPTRTLPVVLDCGTNVRSYVAFHVTKLTYHRMKSFSRMNCISVCEGHAYELKSTMPL